MIFSRESMPLPRTGQSVSYRTGDDGSVQSGQPLSPRFEIVGGGNLVIDWHTMLLWVREVPKIIPGGSGMTAPTARGTWSASANYAIGDLVQGDGSPDSKYYIATAASGPVAAGAIEPPNAAAWVETIWTASASNLITPPTVSWNAAIDACLSLTYGGVGSWSSSNPLGWRLPNMLELLSLWTAASGSGAAIDANAFPNTQLNRYWSSTARSDNPTNRKAPVSFYRGADMIVCYDPSSLLYVRPVRSLLA